MLRDEIQDKSRLRSHKYMYVSFYYNGSTYSTNKYCSNVYVVRSFFTTGSILSLGMLVFYSSTTEQWKHGVSHPMIGLTDRAVVNKTSVVASPPSTWQSFLQYCNFPSSLKSLNEGSMEGTLVFEQQENFKLLQVFMLARHGDRMPAYSFPNLFAIPQLNCSLPYPLGDGADELKFEIWDLNSHKFVNKPLRLKRDQLCGIGSLTVTGHEQHFILGKHFKQAYQKWFNEAQSPSKWADILFVHSTNVQRTMYSAASFLQGFLPEEALYRSRTSIHVSNGLALRGVPPGSNGVYHWCKNLYSDTAKELSSVELQAGHSFYSGVLDRVAAVLGVSKGQLPPKVTQLYDQLMVRACHNLALPYDPKQCTDSTLLTDLTEYADWANVHAFPPRTAVLMMQPFVYNVLFQQMNIAIEKDRQGRSDYLTFLLHFCHDTTLIAFLSAMSAQQKRWPPYATRVVLELWKKEMLSSEKSAEALYYVRLLYNGQPITSELQFASDDFEHDRELLKFSEFSKYITTGDFRAKESYDSVCSHASA